MALVGVRDFLEKRGHKVGWNNDTKEITVDGSVIDKSTFQLEGQRHYGTPTDILNAIGQGGYKSPYATTVDPTMTSKLNKGLQSGLISPNEYQGLNARLYAEADAKNPNSITNIMNQISARQPYQSQYGSNISGIMDRMNQPFQYNPSQDTNLQNAQKQVMESMNERGILNSTMTGEEALKLVPGFQQQAYSQYADQQNQLMRQAEFYRMLDNEGYNRYMDETESLYRRAEFINQLDEQSYRRYKDGVAQDYQDRMYLYETKQAEAEAARQEVSDAWYRVNQLGYIDNESSITLGMPVGTPSKDAREAATKRQQEIEDYIIETQKRAERDDLLFQQELYLLDAKEQSNMRQDQFSSQLRTQEQQRQAQTQQSQQAAQDARINNLFQQMMQGGNPAQWLESVAGKGLTVNEYKTLKALLPKTESTPKTVYTPTDYAKRVERMMEDDSLEPEERKYNALDYLYNLETNGQIDGKDVEGILDYNNITNADIVKYTKLRQARENISTGNLPNSTEVTNRIMQNLKRGD